MAQYVEHKYISLVSVKLDKFKPKGNSLYNFRCPFCLDSKRSKTKARGYFYERKGAMFFRCHNCSRGYSLAGFIKEIDPNLYDQYVFERYKDGKTDKKREAVKEDEILEIVPKAAPTFRERPKALAALESVASLDDAHYCKAYVIGREIPSIFHGSLYFAPDFRAFIDELKPDNEYGNLKSKESRLIIPFWDQDKKLIAVQGRAFEDTDAKYITVKVADVPKVWGLDRVDVSRRLYVLEGPLNAMFLPNAIAAAGSDFPKIDPSKAVFVFDNEPRKRETVEHMEKAIRGGYSVCVWPDSLRWNDINDMIKKGGMKPVEIANVINKNTYSGLRATAQLSFWKKV